MGGLHGASVSNRPTACRRDRRSDPVAAGRWAGSLRSTTMQSMKLVVVEDSLSVRRLLVRRAEAEAGVTVVAQASEEDEAVTAVMSTRPDAVLLDLHLAKGSGLAVLARLREQAYPGPVFIMSAEDPLVYGPLCRRRGAAGFYEKAFDFEQLLEDLHELSHRPSAGMTTRPIDGWMPTPA